MLKYNKFPHSLNYRADIDGLRAVAVLSVIFFHAAPGRFPGGFIGVDIFFVISGFLITLILITGNRSDFSGLIDFYIRRVRRIFPALLTVLTACIAAGFFLLIDEEMKQLSKHLATGASFMSNFLLLSESGYFDQSADFKPLLHLWSLAIEEQFYILWPILIWFSLKIKLNVLATATALMLISFTLNLWQIQSDAVITFYLPFTRFWELLLGAVLACISLQNKTVVHTYLATAASVIGMALLVAALLLIDKNRIFPGWWALLPTVGTALIIWAGPHAIFNKTMLSNRLLVWFGLISFPLYLWHWPILSFLRIVEGAEISQMKRLIAIIVATALAWLTYEWVEKSIRYRRSNWVSLGLVGLMVSIGVVGVAGYFSDGFRGRTMIPKEVNTGEIAHLHFFDHIKKNYFPCLQAEIANTAGHWNGYVRCFQSKSNSVPNVVLLGDSHAEHLFPGLAARMLDSNLAFYGQGGLPFQSNPNYNRIFEIIFSDNNIKQVIISANWAENLNKYSREQWEEKLIDTIQLLTNAGKKVFLIDDVPSFSFNPSRCKFAGRLGHPNLCVETSPDISSNYLPTFNSIANANLNVRVIQIYPLFCSAGKCDMALNGRIFYRDENHLNVLGSEFVASSIIEQMEL